MSVKIKAPYNFVPVSEQVFFPDWDRQVSHDIPFSDGASGMLELTIKAESPIYIRNGHIQKNQGTPETNEFCHANFGGKKQYYIPGTSLKGMTRNVLEILSFSKLSRVNDTKYALRDLKRPDVYTLMKPAVSKKIRGGWLMHTNGTFTIEDAGLPALLNQKKIDDHLGTTFASTFKAGGSACKKGSDQLLEEAKFAQYKYENMAKGLDLRALFKIESNKNEKTIVDFDSAGSEGHIVFTGQASVRKEGGAGKPSGKVHEFVFFKQDNPRVLNVSEEMWQEIRGHYFDADANKRSKDFAYWKQKLLRGSKVPVFYRVEETGENKGRIKDFGFSFLYKMPYEKSVKEALNNAHNSDKADMAELIFGYTREKENLRGRVQFGHAKACMDTAKPLSMVQTVLGSPKASYYPSYIRQQGPHGETPGYKTFNSKDARIKGWKRYPNHDGTVKTPSKGNENEKMLTRFIPLDRSVVFETKVRYHNLRKAELGALVSALTFHLTGDAYHNLGMAKSLGYGKISIAIDNLNAEMQAAVGEFEKLMNVSLFAGVSHWSESDQVRELLTMACNTNTEALEYMELKDHATVKGTMERGREMPFQYLQDFSKINPEVKLPPITKISAGELLKYREENEALELRRKQEQEMQKQAELKEKTDKLDQKLNGLRACIDEDLNKAELNVKEIHLYLEKHLPRHESPLFSKLKEEILLRKKINDADSLFEKLEWTEARLAYEALQGKSMDEIRNQFITKQIELCKTKVVEEIKAAGLAFLKDIDAFDKSKGRMDQWLKKAQLTTVPASEAQELYLHIERWIATADKRSRKDWNMPFDKGAYWKKIATWVSADMAKQWHNKLIAK